MFHGVDERVDVASLGLSRRALGRAGPAIAAVSAPGAPGTRAHRGGAVRHRRRHRRQPLRRLRALRARPRAADRVHPHAERHQPPRQRLGPPRAQRASTSTPSATPSRPRRRPPEGGSTPATCSPCSPGELRPEHDRSRPALPRSTSRPRCSPTTSSPHWPRRSATGEVLALFDAVVESARWSGVRKPDRALLPAGVRPLGIEPDRGRVPRRPRREPEAGPGPGHGDHQGRRHLEGAGRTRGDSRHPAALTVDPWVGATEKDASGEGPAQQVLLLEEVQRRAPGGGAGRLGPAHVAQGEPVPEEAVQASVGEGPRPHVLGLLLDPHHLLGVRVAAEHRGQGLLGPGVELLDPDHGHPGGVDAGDGEPGSAAPSSASRRAMASKATLPEHSRTRRTAPGSIRTDPSAPSPAPVAVSGRRGRRAPRRTSPRSARRGASVTGGPAAATWV